MRSLLFSSLLFRYEQQSRCKSLKKKKWWAVAIIDSYCIKIVEVAVNEKDYLLIFLFFFFLRVGDGTWQTAVLVF
jgi:hypothetical protein